MNPIINEGTISNEEPSMTANFRLGEGPPETSRLPYPPPPQVVVKLTLEQGNELLRLCGWVGLTPGEAAAVLLGSSPAEKLKTLIVAQHALHLEREKNLAAVPTTLTEMPCRTTVYLDRSPIRVSLSASLNQTLYRLAVKSGLKRHEVARELLERIDLAALINEMTGELASSAERDAAVHFDETNNP